MDCPADLIAQHGKRDLREFADQTKHHREAPVLSEEEEARLALPELEDEDLDADLGHQEEEELPYLDAESVASWWRARMDTSDSTRPTLLGQPISSEICLTALHSGSMRRRRALARRIWIGSGGRATIAVDRPTSYQCSNLSRLATTDLVSGNSLAAWR